MKISCRDCWLQHDAYFDCFGEWSKLSKTEEGRAELERRRKAVYTRDVGPGEANARSEAWRWAQKAGASYEALRTLRGGPQESKALEAARKFNRDPDALFLLLLGPPGVGKTVAAALCVVDFCTKWPWNEQPSGGTQADPVLLVEAATLTRLTVHDAESRRYSERLRNCRLLVLEDAGDEATDIGRGLFVELLLAREKTNRRTVITANLRPEAFKSRYGDAAWDRIYAGGYVPGLFGEKSRRARTIGHVAVGSGVG